MAVEVEKNSGQCTRSELGAWGEARAERYLRELECAILARNWHGRGGELDIVAYDPARQSVVAVEVKTRRAHDGAFRAGTPEEAITPIKLRRIRSLIMQWVNEHEYRAPHISVDVIGVAVDGDRADIHHVKDVN